MTRIHLAGIALLATLSGCISVIPYTPTDSLVEEMGSEDAETELQGVMQRSVTPVITQVELSVDKVSYLASLKTGAGVNGPPSEKSFYFRNVTRFEIYENFRTFVFNNDLLLGDFLFNSLGDAQRFTDMVWSFKRQEAGKPTEAPGEDSEE